MALSAAVKRWEMSEKLLLPSSMDDLISEETAARDSLSCFSLLTAEGPSSVRSSAGMEKNLSFVDPMWMNIGVHGALLRHEDGSQTETRFAGHAPRAGAPERELTRPFPQCFDENFSSKYTQSPSRTHMNAV